MANLKAHFSENHDGKIMATPDKVFVTKKGKIFRGNNSSISY